MSYKVCSKCGISKPWTKKYYYSSGKSSGVLRSECKDCCYKSKKVQRKATFLDYDRSLSGHLRKLYRKMKYRVRKQRSYRSREFSIDRDDFFNRFINDPNYVELHRQWKESNYERQSTPSIDRIDNEKGYVDSNIRIITFKENRLKGTDSL